MVASGNYDDGFNFMLMLNGLSADSARYVFVLDMQTPQTIASVFTHATSWLLLDSGFEYPGIITIGDNYGDTDAYMSNTQCATVQYNGYYNCTGDDGAEASLRGRYLAYISDRVDEYNDWYNDGGSDPGWKGLWFGSISAFGSSNLVETATL